MVKRIERERKERVKDGSEREVERGLKMGERVDRNGREKGKEVKRDGKGE